jgi:hypothetical protein
VSSLPSKNLDPTEIEARQDSDDLSPLASGTLPISLYLYRKCKRGKEEGTIGVECKLKNGEIKTISGHFDHLYEIPVVIASLMEKAGLKYDVSPHPYGNSVIVSTSFRRNWEFYQKMARSLIRMISRHKTKKSEDAKNRMLNSILGMVSESE